MTRTVETSKVIRAAVMLAVVALIGAAGLASVAYAQQTNAATLPFWRVRGSNVYMIVGAGSNIAVQIGKDGVMMVDTGTAENADKVLATVKLIQNMTNQPPPPLNYAHETRTSINFNSVEPPKPIRWIINTTIASDHIGGNETLSGSGDTISGGNVGAYAPEGAAIYAREELLARLSEPLTSPKPGDKPVPFGMLPTDTFYQDQMRFSNFVNGEGIMLYHAPNATTDGDAMVYFRGSDVLVVGDVFRMDNYPVIDVAKGGTIQGVLDALNHILDLAIPEFREEGGTMVVPGHGRLADSADVGYYRDMCTIIKDRMQDMVNKGMTLAQVKAAKPTFDYDPRFGSTTGAWTTDMFVDAVYNTLKKK